jgi:molecular chaperone HtpG
MINIPHKFKEILSKNPLLDGQITSTVATFSAIYADNKLYFFPEYTDHGIAHINSVLLAAENIIDENTIQSILSSEDIAVLILAIILHDLGMQLSFDSFKSLIDGSNDDIRVDI